MIKIDQKKADEIAMANVRAQRDKLLEQTEWVVKRHEEQLKLGKTALTEKQFKDVLTYRQALRDLPNNVDAKNPEFPKAPTVLK